MRRIAMIALSMLFIQHVTAKSLKKNKKLKRGDAKTAITLLNLFEKQPKSVTQMYTKAHNVLAAKQNASFADLAMNEEFQALCKKNGITHLGGPMLGATSSEEVSVWTRTLKPAQVKIAVTVDGKEKMFGPVQSTADSDLTAVVQVSGLKPNTSYKYRVLVNGKPITMPKTAMITTAPKPTADEKVRIAFGSCFHRWGLANHKQSDIILSRKPSAMLLLGDIAVQDRKNKLGMHRADYLLRDQHPAWQSLAASIPMYATWDDHDYFANDKAGIPKGFTDQDRIGVHEVFKTSWNNPSYGFNDERRGVFLRTRVGPADIIMVDNRYFRKNKKGSYLGDDQMKWLKEQLLDCKGPFIILSCGSMWSDYVSGGKDSWGKMDPQGREEIFKLIEDNNIGGVLLISGDRHGARGFTIPRSNGFNFYEFEAGSLGGRAGPPASSKNWKTQLYGISAKYAFGEFSIDATKTDPEVTFKLIGDDNNVIYDLTLKRSQLTPTKK